MESFINVKSEILIEMCKIFIERRNKNKDPNLQSSSQAERLQRMALISNSVNLSMTDFCYLCEEVEILKDIKI